MDELRTIRVSVAEVALTYRLSINEQAIKYALSRAVHSSHPFCVFHRSPAPTQAIPAVAPALTKLHCEEQASLRGREEALVVMVMEKKPEQRVLGLGRQAK
ncbi:hypothetical protein CRG98_017174 [Punica granatum]|uniref:Uncharacterized protein n=1 Tax=Punica granatum TaxID=22663 RepID=A0A2I0K1D6_PUNGR|nr:hypothetical protein CRG98_017174 [Punica granatum]